MTRQTPFQRETKETRIRGVLKLDGTGHSAAIATGLGFFDHMLSALARHGMLDLELTAEGDLCVDAHHTMEDVGLTLGTAFAECLGDRAGVRRFGEATVPMDDALVRAVVDLSGRPFLGYRVEVDAYEVGGIAPRLFREFFQGFVNNAGIALHIDRLAGEAPHHVLEAVFKATGRALDMACGCDECVSGVPSTKGTLTA